MSVLHRSGVAFILTFVLMVVAVLEARPDPQTDQSVNREPRAPVSDQPAARNKYPLQVPPASEVLPRLRKLTESRPQTREPKAEIRPAQVRILRQLAGKGALATPKCFRSVPTRDEFLDMVRDNPADANQILQRCNIDLRNISPLPQLPVGSRQLPEDTRQRPVGTWGNN